MVYTDSLSRSRQRSGVNETIVTRARDLVPEQRRLYDICEQKQWASEGRVYNQLHQEWDVIESRASELAETDADLFSR